MLGKRGLRRRPILCAGRPVTLIILAGGRSRRMKRNKALLPVPGGTLIGHILSQVEDCFDEIIVSVSPGCRWRLDRRIWKTGQTASGTASGAAGGKKSGRGLRFVKDAAPELGPMAGIISGLRAASNEVCAVLACDIPHIHIGFLRRLARKGAACGIVVPVDGRGRLEPLFAVYRRKVAPAMKRLLDSGKKSLLPLMRRPDVCRVPLGDSGWLKNLNTQEDYRRFLKTF